MKKDSIQFFSDTCFEKCVIYADNLFTPMKDRQYGERVCVESVGTTINLSFETGSIFDGQGTYDLLANEDIDKRINDYATTRFSVPYSGDALLVSKALDFITVFSDSDSIDFITKSVHAIIEHPFFEHTRRYLTCITQYEHPHR